MSDEQQQPTTLYQITNSWLKEHGFDGLYNADTQCACKVDDLMPCEGDYGPSSNCSPGYETPCPDGCGGEHVFHISKAVLDAAGVAKP